jgi:ribonucleoside-diphosphate reductase alpha chain
MELLMLTGFAKEIWEMKYKADGETKFSDTARRVAKAIASVEKSIENKVKYEEIFYKYIASLEWVPGGRITAGAGTKNNHLNNCYVIGIKDSIEDIYEQIKRTAMISKTGGGVGFNCSSLRPKGALLSTGGDSSGAVSWLKVFDASCGVIKNAGGRRAALISILNIDHPDIEEFIDAKREEGNLTNFNLSVGITNDFINAVKNDLDWDLKFNGIVYKTVSARALFNKLCYSAWMYNDPGLFMLDNVNYMNNGYYIESIDCPNPCGELPLFHATSCVLGNINVTKYVVNPFEDTAYIDTKKYAQSVEYLVRFLDNVIDYSDYPLSDISDKMKKFRRIGLNPIAGIGSALAMLKIPYDSDEAITVVGDLFKLARNVAYNASCSIAAEKGSFPELDLDKYLEGNFIKLLPEPIKNNIIKFGIRNMALLTVPPVGTGSLIAGNISNGLEPIFSLEYKRKVKQIDGSTKTEDVEDYAWKIYKEKFNTTLKPEYFKTSMEIDPISHVNIMAVIAKYNDGAASKTVNLPESYTLDEYKKLLMFSIDSGLMGFTSYRAGSRDAVLFEGADPKGSNNNSYVPDQSIKRPRVLDGKIYQLKEDNAEHKTYCTLSYYEQDGDKIPWEMFLFSSSKNHEWYTAIGRLASKLMRRTGNIKEVIDELKAIKGDNGFLTKEYGYVYSRPYYLACVLEEFSNSISSNAATSSSTEKCSKCGENSVVREGGCAKCLSCGYSHCG